MADAVSSLSGTSNPYASTSYTASSNDKNTLTITSYFKLLAAQLANQDMSDPMDNSEMMAQMTQMAMVQSMSAMTESIQTSTAVSTQTYAASLVGQGVTMAVVDKNGDAVGVKYGTVASVNFTGSNPTIRLEDDDTEYSLSQLLGMGNIDNPYEEKTETDKSDKSDKVEGGSGESDKSDKVEESSGESDKSDKVEGSSGESDESDKVEESSGESDKSDKVEGSSGESDESDKVEESSGESDKSDEVDETPGEDESESGMTI